MRFLLTIFADCAGTFAPHKTLYVTILICEEIVKTERLGFMRIFGYLYKFEEFGSNDVRILSKIPISIRELRQDAGRMKNACKQERIFRVGWKIKYE